MKNSTMQKLEIINECSRFLLSLGYQYLYFIYLANLQNGLLDMQNCMNI